MAWSALKLAKDEAVRLKSLIDLTKKNIREQQDLLPALEKELVNVKQQIQQLDV